MTPKFKHDFMQTWILLLLLVCSATIVHGELTCSHVETYDDNQVLLLHSQCYHFAQDAVSWTNAADRCRSNNGTLASIPDSTVNTVLITHARNLDYSNLANVSFYWLGGQVRAFETGVSWIQDPGTGFLSFNDGEPYGFAEYGCLMLDPSIAGWVTDLCVSKLELVGYICVYPSIVKSGSSSVLGRELQLIPTNMKGIIFFYIFTHITTR